MCMLLEFFLITERCVYTPRDTSTCTVIRFAYSDAYFKGNLAPFLSKIRISMMNFDGSTTNNSLTETHISINTSLDTNVHDNTTKAKKSILKKRNNLNNIIKQYKMDISKRIEKLKLDIIVLRSKRKSIRKRIVHEKKNRVKMGELYLLKQRIRDSVSNLNLPTVKELTEEIVQIQAEKSCLKKEILELEFLIDEEQHKRRSIQDYKLANFSVNMNDIVSNRQMNTSGLDEREVPILRMKVEDADKRLSEIYNEMVLRTLELPNGGLFAEASSEYIRKMDYEVRLNNLKAQSPSKEVDILKSQNEKLEKKLEKMSDECEELRNKLVMIAEEYRNTSNEKIQETEAYISSKKSEILSLEDEVQDIKINIERLVDDYNLMEIDNDSYRRISSFIEEEEPFLSELETTQTTEDSISFEDEALLETLQARKESLLKEIAVLKTQKKELKKRGAKRETEQRVQIRILFDKAKANVEKLKELSHSSL